MKYLLVAGLILGGLAVAAVLGFALMIQSSFPEVKALAAPVAWTTSEVRLTPDRPLVVGTLTLTATSVPGAGAGRVGVNAGAPAVVGADELTNPLVRLATAEASGTPQACAAPCERDFPADFDCRDGTCRMVLDVTVELARGSVGSDETVQVVISGGISAELREGRLPEGLVVELRFDGTAHAR